MVLGHDFPCDDRKQPKNEVLALAPEARTHTIAPAGKGKLIEL
jgi:hypothetical protein